MEAEKTKIIKILNNKDLNSADDVKAAVKRLENITNTTSMTNAEQQKIIKEMKHLNDNIDSAARLSQIKPKIAELRKSKESVYEELKFHRSEFSI